MTRSGNDEQAVVSVCVPAYQAEAFIGATIESVLAQTYQSWELIILDNNSGDRTGEIARSYTDPRIRVESNPATLDLAENWNAVSAMATGRYLKLLCADDILHPDCLTEQVAALECDDDVVLVACRRDFIGPDGEVVLERRGLRGIVGHCEAASVVSQVVRSGINPIGWPGAMLLRRSVFVEVGAFDTRWLYPIDLELSLRMLGHGSFHGLDRSLASFRISPGSASSTLSNQGNQHRQVLRMVAADPRWNIDPGQLRRGLLFSYIETAKKSLLFAAINSRWPAMRRLPSLFLRPGRSGQVASTGKALPGTL
jgi:glycosyltransferase involved in cell wall biosynthesis